MLLALKVPADNQRGPRFMQEALAAIHQAGHQPAPVRFEFGCHDGYVGLYCRVADDSAEQLRGFIAAKYPNCRFEQVDNEAALVPPLTSLCETVEANLVLTPSLFPILRHTQFEDIAAASFADPIDAVLRSVEPDSSTHARIEISISPTGHWRNFWAKRAVDRLNQSYFRAHETRSHWYVKTIMHPFLWPIGWLLGMRAGRRDFRSHTAPVDQSAGRHHDREDDVQAASDKVGGHLFDARIRLVAYAPKGQRHLARARLRAMAGAFGSFTVSRLSTFRLVPARKYDRPCPFLLSHEELATLWHPPTATVGNAHLSTTEFTELEAPTVLNAREGDESDENAVLGWAKHRGADTVVRLACDDRRRHLYVVGKTGMGKTTLLENQILADIHAGRGVCLIDPHGDLADRVTESVPPQRTNDVMLFDPNDPDYAIAYNPLRCFDPDRRDLVADDVLSAFSKVYDLSHSPRLKDTLRNALYVLIEKDLTLMHLLLLLADERHRRSVLVNIEDELVRMFWEREFPSWNRAYRTEALSAVQNKVRPFLMNTKVRAIVGQCAKPINLRETLDEGRVLIVNLSKGKLGEDNSALLGSLLVSSIQQAAMSRADMPEDQRRDFYLYVDEFQNFTTGSFATILSEARKYRLNLTVAHQYLRQLDVRTADAVFGNVGSLVAFQVGSDDAVTLAQQFSKHAGQLRAQDMANLPKYTAYARLLVNGLPTAPFSLRTNLPTKQDENRATKVRDASRRQFAQPLTVVRKRLHREIAMAG
jgi:hypothetical protein